MATFSSQEDEKWVGSIHDSLQQLEQIGIERHDGLCFGIYQSVQCLVVPKVKVNARFSLYQSRSVAFSWALNLAVIKGLRLRTQETAHHVLAIHAQEQSL